MKRFARRVVLSLVVLIAASCLVIVLVLRASLPKLDGEIDSSEISADITIERDAMGIPTIRAENRVDLAYGTGFAHGQDRFFQMDLTRRQPAGELAEIIGEVALAVDKRNRFHRFRSRAKEVIALMTAEEAEIMKAYADGVNAGLASLGAKPFEYFVLGVSPVPW